jgi:hypothetical protein
MGSFSNGHHKNKNIDILANEANTSRVSTIITALPYQDIKNNINIYITRT